MTKIAVILPCKISEPWQAVMTAAAGDTLGVTTDVPFDLFVPYRPTAAFPESPIVTGGRGSATFIPARDGQSPTDEINATLDRIESEGYDFAVYTGNDIFTRPGWLEALLEPFERFPDCGCSTVWSSELNRTAEPGAIREGVYGPFMMFRPTWRYDPDFPSQFADTDLVMRMYEAGRRSYRNCGVVIHHLLRQTVNAEANQMDFEASHKRFMAKHAGSPHLMFQILAGGKVV